MPIVIAVFFIAAILYGHSPIFPEGKQFTYTHDGYTAIVIVSHEVCSYNTGFIVGGFKTEGVDLARACAISMKITDQALRKNGPHWKLRREGHREHKIQKQHFYFSSLKTFNKNADKAYKKQNSVRPETLMAFTTSTDRRFKFFRPGPDLISIPAGHMHLCTKKGQLAVHEMIHVISLSLWGHRDSEHKLWNDKDYFVEGRSLSRICLDDWKIENAK